MWYVISAVRYVCVCAWYVMYKIRRCMCIYIYILHIRILSLGGISACLSYYHYIPFFHPHTRPQGITITTIAFKITTITTTITATTITYYYHHCHDHNQYHEFHLLTLLSFNIAMGNGPFVDASSWCSYETWCFSIAALSNQRVYPYECCLTPLDWSITAPLLGDRRACAACAEFAFQGHFLPWQLGFIWCLWSGGFHTWSTVHKMDGL